MKMIKIILSSLAAVLIHSAEAEEVTLVAVKEPTGPVATSQTITLNQGDTATCKFWYSTSGTNESQFNCVSNSVPYTLHWFLLNERTGQPVIVGPATISMSTSNGTSVATFQINRAGLSSPPAAIPQEAGTTWDVILESSSDLINWTPTNPGEYSGTEPKRFFRTRMVKKENP